MTKSKLQQRALSPAAAAELEEIRATLRAMRVVHQHDGIAKLVAESAIAAALEGNKGVAAIALIPKADAMRIPESRRKEMRIEKHTPKFLRMCRGNQRYFPQPRNVRHAESVLVHDLEELYYAEELGQVVQVFSSLEPCSKCLPQLIDCKPVMKVFYMAPDPGGGHIEAHDRDGILRLEKLPWNFKENAAFKGSTQGIKPPGMTIGRADCSEELRHLCWRIFVLTDPDAGDRRDGHEEMVHALSQRTWKTLRKPKCDCCGPKSKLGCS